MSQRRHFATGEARAARADRFAAALAVALHELGLTHKALAQELGLTRYTVDSWTRVADPMLPGEENLARLCTVLDAHRPGLGQQLAAAAGAPARPLPPPDPPPGHRPPPPPPHAPPPSPATCPICSPTSWAAPPIWPRAPRCWPRSAW